MVVRRLHRRRSQRPLSGGQSSNVRIAVTGANSSVGQNFMAHATKLSDLRVVAVVRSEQALASLPFHEQIQPHNIPYERVDDLANALEGVTCVIHLAGILLETRSATYQRANVDTTASVIEAAQVAGAEHIIFISVLGADAHSQNAYFRSKGEAEQLVVESGIDSTVIRTPILLGPGNAGANGLFRAATGGKVRLLGGGTYTMRPLDLDDLSSAVLQVCRAPQEGATIHELVGPEAIPYKELISRLARMLDQNISIAAMPIWLAKMAATVSFRFKGKGISPTVIDVITMTEVVERNADKELGIELTPLSDTLQKLLHSRTHPI